MSSLLQLHRTFLENHINDSSEENLTNSIIPPGSYWTPREKQLFFHALKRYSRLQPELIQQAIGDTKSIWDVCLYIEHLDSACQRENCFPTKRDEVDSCAEMTASWSAFEERQAAALILHEQKSLQDFYKRKRKNSDVGDVSGERSQRIRSELEAQWRSREVMQRLDSGMMIALDSILRRAEKDESLDTESQSEYEVDDVNETTALDLPPVSAVNQKKHKNRILMRRKRAESRGEVYNEAPDKLKTGRKRNTADPPPRRKHSKPGLVTFEKNMAFFNNAKLTARDIRREGLDLFHLATFGKLLGILNQLNHDSDWGSTICSELISLLRGYLICFLAKLIRHIIVFVEQEQRRTEHTKIFKRSRNRITGYHVRHIARLNTGDPDPSSFLKRLARQTKGHFYSDPESRSLSDSDSDSDSENCSASRAPSEDQASSACDSEPSSSSNAEADTDDSSATSSINGDIPHEDPPIGLDYHSLQVPFMWVPTQFSQSPLDTSDCDLDVSLPFNDDDALIDELEEERELDKADKKKSRQEERELWAEVRRLKAAANGEEITLQPERLNTPVLTSKKKRKPMTTPRALKCKSPDLIYLERSGKMKSAVMIEDSDVDTD